MNPELQALLEKNSWMLNTAAISTGLCLFFFVLTVYYLKSMVQEDDRAYMDPLPFSLKLIWPFIQIISYFFCSLLPYEWMERIEKRLQHTGVKHKVT